MSRDRMKAQSDARDPEARGGDPASAQITDHHASPRNAMQLGDQAHGILPLEVMEKLRTQHDVDALVGEGKLERVGAERVVQSTARGGGENVRSIESNGAQTQAASSSDLPCTPRNVGEPGADVHERRDGLGARNRPRTPIGRASTAWCHELVERWTEDEQHRAPTAKEEIRTLDVPVRTLAIARIDARLVENLDAASAARASGLAST